MKQQRFNDAWEVMNGVIDPFFAIYGGPPATRHVTLPQDEMILEERDPNCKSATQTGFYPAGTYTYTKKFHAPEEWQSGQQYLEFEGIMGRSMVYINNQFAAANANGYSQFFVDLKPYLNYGKENQIRVIAANQDQSSRWYSGSGIYRDVNLLTGGKLYVVPEGVRLTTEYVEDDYAMIRAEVVVKNIELEQKNVVVKLAFYDVQEKKAAEEELALTVEGNQKEVRAVTRISVKNPKLWSPESPHLYRCEVEILADGHCVDTASEEFGIRTLRLDSIKGLQINNKTVKLRGCCIHHDNGIIGATTLYQAEEFRVQNLKMAGFNSVRSSHNSMSKAMLKACDRLGILVMDELGDIWNVPKNCYDFSFDFSKNWEEEVERIVSKDYNHPCVILYSCGNEIPDLGYSSGKRMNREIANLFRKLDPTRYTTGGVNGLLVMGDSLLECRNSLQEKAQVQGAAEQGESAGGSEAMNAAMADMQKQRQTMDAFSVNPVLTNCLEEISGSLDVAGFNYLTARHELEHELHPDRIVVGSETYPSETALLWEIVENNDHVIGDFTWTGYDYLGEAGIGIFHYDNSIKKQGVYPDRLAYCGDININAYRRPASYLREIAYGLRQEPYIAVEYPEHYGQAYDGNGWKYCDGVDSWTHNGYEGKPVKLRVLAKADEVEVFLNGCSKGRKKIGEYEKLTAFYDVKYEPGTLEAVSFLDGKEQGRTKLVTAGEPVRLNVKVQNPIIRADGAGMAFLIVEPVDEEGRVNRQSKKQVSIEVNGSGYLAGFGSADPSSTGSYQDTTAETFDGRVMAAVRSTDTPGVITVRVWAEGCGEQTVTITAN